MVGGVLYVKNVLMRDRGIVKKIHMISVYMLLILQNFGRQREN
jgi:hypothetical protein